MINRTYRLLDPWAGFEEVFDALAPWNTSRTRSGSFPAVNFHREGDEGIVTAELPGVAVEDLDISVVGRNLTISGERKAPQTGEGETVHRSERWHGAFKRTVELPFNVEADKVEAKLENGILTVKVPRAEADKPRKISINLN